MKRFTVGIVVFVIGILAMSVFNNSYLLWNHPLSYYYTAEGFMKVLKFATVEGLIALPLTYLGIRYFFSEEKTDKNVSKKES